MKIKITPEQIEKLKKVFLWILKEAVSGIVVAAAVAVATLGISVHRNFEIEQEKLKSLYLGLNQKYIESVLGVPIVEFSETGNDTIRSYYKQPHSVVSCSYADEQLVAYFVFVNTDKKLYRIPDNFMISSRPYLADFTYAEFSDKAETYDANCPANNDDFAYYTERYHGGNIAKYNYFLIGSYKNYFDETYVPLVANAMDIDTSYYLSSEYEAVRGHAKPNVFGMIDSAYKDSIELLSFDDNTQTYCNAIFSGWR